MFRREWMERVSRFLDPRLGNSATASIFLEHINQIKHFNKAF